MLTDELVKGMYSSSSSKYDDHNWLKVKKPAKYTAIFLLFVWPLTRNSKNMSWFLYFCNTLHMVLLVQKMVNYHCICSYIYIYIFISKKHILTTPEYSPSYILKMRSSGWRRMFVWSALLKASLKLTCHHINRRHFCFNIKSISVHPLLWMNVMLDFICMVFAGMWTTLR